MKGEKKKLGIPNVYVILFMMVLLAALLTWIIPAGQFERIQAGGRSVVVADSYKNVDQNPQGLWAVFYAITIGFGKSASLIFMIFFAGAAIHMLQVSGAIEISFRNLASKVQGKEWIAILIVMATLSLGGATGAISNATLALIPIGILLSQSMGFDKGLGFAIVFFGMFSGFNVGWANAGTIGIAQNIAEIPMFSGMNVRVVIHIINFALCYGFVLLYARNIKKDFTKSLNYETGMTKEEVFSLADEDEKRDGGDSLNWKQTVSLIAIFVSFAFVIFGVLNWKWGPNQYTSVFLMLALFVGLINGFGINGTAKEFIQGCQKMVFAAFIVGLARGITIIMTDGLILDTIVYGLSIPIKQFGSVFGANMMYLSNIIINLFISSGSGQATSVMPIMVPLADITGITRQVAVQAYQFGDGFTNIIVPTVGTLMGGLGFAKVAYPKYFKWVWPLLVSQLALGFIVITILQSIQWTGL